jgi:tRNA (mo5U34)-methyltransferase
MPRLDLGEVAEREWYHTLELAPGVTTPGYFDHTPILPKLPIPPSLAGQRCLDIGTFDGFWAFEMERRGATEVVAADIIDPMAWDWPAGAHPLAVEALERRKEAGRGFEIAARALGSNVEKVEASVYDLAPEIHGQFDFVFMGSLLLHLRDPIRALERVRSVCRGSLLTLDAVDPLLTLLHPRRPIAFLDGVARPWWWKPNLRGYERMVSSAGFEVLRGPIPVLIPAGAELKRKRVALRALRGYEGRQALIRRYAGDPHAFILARSAA